MYTRLIVTFSLIIVIVLIFVFTMNKDHRQIKSSPKVMIHPGDEQGTPVQAQMENVNFHIDPDIVMQIKQLRGELLSTEKSSYPVFDLKNSFYLRIFSGEIGIDMKSLSNLLNRYVFGYKGSSLKDLEISIEQSQIKQEGKMKGIPFTVFSQLSVTPQGLIRLHPVKIKAAGINVTGIMKFFKIELDQLITTRKNLGASIKDNDFYLDPSGMLPPPKIQGHLSSIKLGKNELFQIFTSSGKKDSLHPDSIVNNYMYYKEGKLGFGKLTMFKTDMLIIDKDQKDSFDFFLDRYVDQLTAGYHITTKKQGLIIYMPDYNDLKLIKK